MMRTLAIAAVILVAAGTARPADVAPEGGRTGVAPADRQFINEAASGGQLEVELGRLAQSNAASEQVRRFGKRMVDDHGRANQELADLAERRGVTVDRTMKADQKASVETLGRLKGDAFDRRYVALMLRDHREDIQKFQRAADSAVDPELRAFARRMLPALRQHLQLAQSVAGATSGTGR